MLNGAGRGRNNMSQRAFQLRPIERMFPSRPLLSPGRAITPTAFNSMFAMAETAGAGRSAARLRSDRTVLVRAVRPAPEKLPRPRCRALPLLHSPGLIGARSFPRLLAPGDPAVRSVEARWAIPVGSVASTGKTGRRRCGYNGGLSLASSAGMGDLSLAFSGEEESAWRRRY